MFSKLRLSEMLFLFINCLISIFPALSTNKPPSENKRRPEQH